MASARGVVEAIFIDGGFLSVPAPSSTISMALPMRDNVPKNTGAQFLLGF